MALANISIRVDSNVKKNFCNLCEEFGLTTTAAFNLFMKAVIRERRIPFDIAIDHRQEARQAGINAFQALRAEAAKNSLQDWTLEEINAEIKATRDERCKKSQ